jgi:hypothetical protein
MGPVIELHHTGEADIQAKTELSFRNCTVQRNSKITALVMVYTSSSEIMELLPHMCSARRKVYELNKTKPRDGTPQSV